jgi:hypothetical protein
MVRNAMAYDYKLFTNVAKEFPAERSPLKMEWTEWAAPTGWVAR